MSLGGVGGCGRFDDAHQRCGMGLPARLAADGGVLDGGVLGAAGGVGFVSSWGAAATDVETLVG